MFNHNSEQYIEYESASIYYEVIGNKNNPALLFLHGGLGNIEELNIILSELIDDYYIIGIDNRGHGKSSLGSISLTYELLQKEVEAVLKHLNITKLSIIGFSNGGTIAYRLASFTSLKIDKLITIGAPWSNKRVEHLHEPYSKLTVDLWKSQCLTDYESWLKLNKNLDIAPVFNAVTNMALDRSDKSRPNESVNNINCPVLMVRGEEDPIVSHDDLVALSHILYDAEIVTIPSVGHRAFHKGSEFFFNKLNSFLQVKESDVNETI